MRAPGEGELFHVRMSRQCAKFVYDLKTFANTQIAGGKDVGAIERKDEEHVRRPDTDAFDLREVCNNFVVCKFVQRAMLDRTIRELLREVSDIGSFLCGESGRTQFCGRCHSHVNRRGESFAGEECLEALQYCRRCSTGHLLVDDRAYKRLERVPAML